MNAIVFIFIILVCWVIKKYFDGIKVFNIANSIILAAITYDQLSEKEREWIDQMLIELLCANPHLKESPSSLNEAGRELVKWRWYSVVFANNHVPPFHSKKMGWAECKNVYQDTRLVRLGIPKIDEYLQKRQLFTRYLWWLEMHNGREARSIQREKNIGFIITLFEEGKTPFFLTTLYSTLKEAKEVAEEQACQRGWGTLDWRQVDEEKKLWHGAPTHFQYHFGDTQYGYIEIKESHQ